MNEVYFHKNIPVLPAILCMGDSLTASALASGLEAYWPTILARSYPNGGRPIWNYGVGGETSTQIATRHLALNGFRDAPTTFWAGRNNYTSPTTVKADIASMVAYKTNEKYLVLSILNGDFASEYSGAANYKIITDLNNDLLKLYGDRFLDVRTPLVAAYSPGTPQDVTDHGRDIPPSTLRGDGIHLNDAGYAIVAALVKAKFVSFNW